MEHKRSHRVAHLIQQELGQLLVEGVKDPRVGFVTVTHVRLTDDLKSACAYVSIFGDDTQRQASLAGLRHAVGFLRRELGHRLQLRYTPVLSFAHDDSLDRAQRLQTLLNAVERGEHETPPEDALPALPPAQTARVAGPMEIPEPPAKLAKPTKRARTNRRTRRSAQRRG